MVNMRYQHLHSEVRQSINQRILQQWKSILFSHNCQTRHVTHAASRSNKVFSLINELDALEQQEVLQQMKSSGRRRIPIHISSKLNALHLPSLLSLQSHLQKGESELAWQMFEQSASQLAQQSIPHSTTHQLLLSLHDLVNTNLPRLLFNFGKLQELYFSRLETLAGVIRRNKDAYWDKDEFASALELYGKLNQIKRAESLFKNMTHYTLPGTTPSAVDYNQMLTVYLRHFKHVDIVTRKRILSKMQTLTQDMAKKGIQPTTHTYNVMLAALVKTHDLQGAEKLFSQMTVKPDHTTFHVLLNGYLKACRTKADKDMIQVWLERLIEAGIAPTKKTFHSIMEGLAGQAQFLARTNNNIELAGTVDSLNRLYQAMVEAGHRPDTETINALLQCYTAANDTERIDTVMATLEFPEKKGGCGNCGNCGCGGGGGSSTVKKEETHVEKKIKPDMYTFNMLIKYHLSHDRTDQAFQMYDTMVTAKLEPDTVTYSNFIWYYAQKGNVTELLRYVDVMEKKGIPYNNTIYNTLFNCALKYPQDAELLQPYLRNMVASGSSTLDAVSRNTQLARYQFDGDHVEESFEEFTDILERNLHAASYALDTRTYNTILQSAGQFYKPASKNKAFSKFSRALDGIIESLDTTGLRGDVYTYALGIRNAAYVGHMEKAESIYKKMVDAGIRPNEYIFSHLIYGYATIGKVEKAQALLDYMESQYQLSPNAINYAPVIKGFAESAEYEKANRLFRDMLDKNVTADLVIYTILASVFLKSPVQGNGKRAIELLEGIEKAGIALDAPALTTLAEAYALDAQSLLCHESVGQEKSHEWVTAYIHKMESIYSRLKENAWLDAKSITMLLVAYNSFRNPEATWKFWNALKAESSVQVCTLHYNLAITGLASSKVWFPVAKMMYEEMRGSPTTRPDAQTYDMIIWGAYSVSDYQTVRQVCHHMQENKSAYPLMVKTYYATLTALLKNNEVEVAKKVFDQYRHLPSAPNSTTVWVGLINKLALHYGLD